MDCAVDGMTWFFMVCKREGEVGRTTGPLRLCGKVGVKKKSRVTVGCKAIIPISQGIEIECTQYSS